jgi:hypothetical protein
MLTCIAAGAIAGALVVAVAYLLHRRAERKRYAEEVMRAWEGNEQPPEGGVCIWNREDPINGTRIRVAPKRRG